ncbi:hypothetical protein H0H93_009860 [Arthromyces matolae]|nr:hypothetical protein H0H93_009860 [Arthromyces matolae]
MAVQSYHSYPGSPATMIGRDITPVNELTWQETPISPEITVQKFSPATVRSLGLHTRQPSNEPTGLTAAPRRIRSPVLHRPSIEHLSVVQGTWSPEHPPSPPSAHIFGRRDSITDSDYPSSPLSGSPISNAATLSAPSPRTLALKPLPGLPRHSRSFSAVPTIAPAPSGRQRPLFTSRHGSIGHAAEMSQQGAF